MKILPKVIVAAGVLATLMAQPAQAKRAYHHHASFYANHPHYGQRSRHHRSFVHHAAHYAAHYAVHYEIRRAVRAALAPIDGRAAATDPRQVAAPPAIHVRNDAADQPRHVAALSAPDHAPPAPQPATVVRTEFAHAGPRVGIDLAAGDTRVVAVTEGSPAYAAGVYAGDLIKKANGAPIKSGEDFAKAINEAAPSGALKLTIERAGREYNATIALGQGVSH
jgi:membrane-associated protease RseP (regulator of RpoE activity)